MVSSHFLFFFLLLLTLSSPKPISANPELTALMDLKSSVDPENAYLSSWVVSGDPCDGSFEGVACNEKGQVANISLQGKGLTGKLSPAVGGLKHLTGLYLHYNSLYGEIPKDISYLAELSDLYLNINNFSGEIPSEIGNMQSLQVLQLSHNQLTGSIPTQLGSLRKLNVLALQSNQLTGAIPASFGEIRVLMRLDLSFNNLFGSIPTKLADAPLLEVLNVRNNTLSGNVPLALKRLVDGFHYENNPGLCGDGFPSLRSCNALDNVNPNRPEPYGGGSTRLPTRDIPETANLNLNCTNGHCSKSSKTSPASVAVGVVVVSVIVSAIGILTFTQYRRRKQKLGSAFDISDSHLGNDQANEVIRKNGSPLVSLEYSNGWDPLAEGRRFGVPQEVMQKFRLNSQEIETATQYFADKNLLGKSNYSVTYKGTLRDGSAVAIKRITKTSCKSEEAEFLKGLNIVTSLRHENLVRLRGFCCSRGRGECFLVYDFIPNGNLFRYLDFKEGDGQILEWSTRVSIINSIAKGIEYLHAFSMNKPSLVHQNISAKNVLIDQQFKPLLSDSGLHKLLTNDTIFSVLKTSAGMGYLAPEYTNTGRFTEKSDVYAFGVLVFQILSGKRKYTTSMRAAAESCRFQELIDANLHGSFFEPDAVKIAKVAVLCTHDYPEERPSMETIIQELSN
ncbi:LRR receptor-like serine/threonine-protein kinase GSO2 [Olea europaea var. sylvestris]|uniref:LRR receptor-like serine/threonine-protein kinase GSO2 n=1 Tax=Olea europaea var. sylvestris TaxID=158386 RepID=UPI000C1CE566|nr:LRR receptor-like serine/threonine-protein kinase GSO2 [Olea europaea var. sylvestris]